MLGLRDVLVVAPAASFHPHHHHDAFLSSAEHPIIPLLTAAPCQVDSSSQHDASRTRIPTGIHLWQNQQTQALQISNPNSSSPYFRKPMPTLDSVSITSTADAILNATVGGTIGVGFSGGVRGGSPSTSTCQDCGNQAKKDCCHGRCRTCCKSRGFDCSTHVKSTWVPVARRRERQGSVTVALAAGSAASTAVPKKPRLVSSHHTTTASHTSTSDTSPPRSFDTGSSHQDASFRDKLPGQVTAPAVFKCVRVTSVDDGEDEYAYQAMVRIAGHIFKGFLYDQGLEERDQSNIGSDTNTNKNNDNNVPNISELHLGGGGPSDVYPSHGSGGRLMGSTVYGNPIN